MYPEGTLLAYGRNGVCKVLSVGEAPFRGADPHRLYYTLSPLYGNETIYVPVDTRVLLRPILTREEAEALIRSIPSIQAQTVEVQSLPALSRWYQDACQTSDCGDLVRLIKTIYQKNASAGAHGRKPGKLDQRYMRLAEDQLYGELAVALDMDREEVPRYIKQVLSGSA